MRTGVLHIGIAMTGSLLACGVARADGAAGTSVGQIATQEASSDQPQLIVHLLKAQVSPGEAIRLSLTVRNSTGKDLRYRRRALMVARDLVVRKVVDAGANRRVDVPPRAMAMPAIVGKAPGYRLSPGEELRYSVEMDRHFDLSSPGLYQISVRWYGLPEQSPPSESKPVALHVRRGAANGK